MPTGRRTLPARSCADYSGRPLDVVVADDNVDAAKTLAALLKTTWDIRFASFTMVSRPCRRSANTIPDLAIIDIGMPVLSGYEAATRISKELGAKNGVYLAALTGWGQEEDRRRALDAGFDAHVVKPVEASRLNAILEAAARPHSHKVQFRRQ